MKQKKLIVQMKILIWKVLMEMIENHNIGKFIKKIIVRNAILCLFYSYSDDDEDITSEEEADIRLTGTLNYFS